MTTPPYSGGKSSTNDDARKLAGACAVGVTLLILSLIAKDYYDDVIAFFRSIYGYEWAELATFVSGGILAVISYYLFKIAFAAALFYLMMQLPRLAAV